MLVKEQIDSFESMLREEQVENTTVNTFAGTSPEAPMAVFYLGEKSSNYHNELTKNLRRLWRPYIKDICFLQVNHNENNAIFDLFNMVTKELVIDINDLVIKMFGKEKNFTNRNQLFLYFIVDSTIVSNDSMAEQVFKMIRFVKESIQLNIKENDILFVTLEEMIKNNHLLLLSQQFSDSYFNEQEVSNEKKKKHEEVDSIFLIGNKPVPEGPIASSSLQVTVIANLIALSNQKKRLANILFSHKIKTIGYAIAEKPFHEISKVVITELVQELEQKTKKTLVGKEELITKLGISPAGTLEVLDRYVDEISKSMLPTVEQLNYFPRKSKDDINLSSISASKFNDITLGAWSQFLLGFENKASGKLISLEETGVNKAYENILLRNFSPQQLVTLKRESFNWRDYISTREISENQPLLNVATQKLRKSFSEDEKVLKNFEMVFESCVMKATEYMEVWDKFTDSLGTITAIQEKSLESFYKKKLHSYFDSKSDELMDSFSNIRSEEELAQFFKKVNRELFGAVPVLTYSFEKEKQARLETYAPTVDAKDQILNDLSSDAVRRYFDSPYSIDKYKSIILFKTGTDLERVFKRSFAEGVFYYNTGFSGAAEALDIYVLKNYHLVREEPL